MKIIFIRTNLQHYKGQIKKCPMQKLYFLTRMQLCELHGYRQVFSNVMWNVTTY